jgi:hypothetical protein
VDNSGLNVAYPGAIDGGECLGVRIDYALLTGRDGLDVRKVPDSQPLDEGGTQHASLHTCSCREWSSRQ